MRYKLLSAMLIVTQMGVCADLDIRGKRIMVDEVDDAAELPYLGNPATMTHRYSSNFSVFNAEGSYAGSEEPQVEQTGTGHLSGRLNAHSYMRLSPATVVWGGARFQTGERRNLRWTEAVDYDRVAPYVLADSVGGDLSGRRYGFYGGYAGSRDGWSWGAKGSYEASIDYRDRDPRDKIVVSDLHIDLGVSRDFGNYSVGAGVGLNVYNQDSDLEFYNPVNNIRVYVLTGLGTTYSRFSGNSSEKSAYDGIGYDIALTLIPHSQSGAWGAVRYRQGQMKQILRDFNNMQLTHANTYYFEGECGYRFSGTTVNIAPRGRVDWRRRIGTENIFGSSVGTDYNKIGEHTYYYCDRVVATAGAPMTIKLSHSTQLEVVPEGVWHYEHENYRTPKRDLESQRYTAHLKVGCTFSIGERCRVKPAIAGSLSWGDAMNRKLTGLNANSGIGRMVLHNYEMLTADYRSAGVSVSSLYTINQQITLQFRAQASRRWIQRHGQENVAEVTAGVIF